MSGAAAHYAQGLNCYRQPSRKTSCVPVSQVKGQHVDTVLKEVAIFVLVYNLVRLLMLKAARRQRVNPHRLSFIDALRGLQPPKPETPLPPLVVNPERPGRVEPRCIKRHMKEYDLMTRPRRELRKRLRKRRDAA